MAKPMTSEEYATRWFVGTMILLGLYVAAVFTFVL
jgi:hypothetical protein